MRVLLSLIVIVGALVASLSSSSIVHGERVDLESVCANKHIDITKRSQVRALVEQLSSDEDAKSACSNRVKAALVELDQMINNSDIEDVCSLEEVGKIKEFYEKYLAQAVEGGEQEGSIPRVLRNFALGYGLKVSNLCKKNMINSLQYESKQLLKPDDFALLNPLTDENSAISHIMDEPSDYDDLLLPRDLNRVLQGEDEDGSKSDDDKIFLQTATGHMIAKTQAICERRFKPIYEQLILPLIYLSNLGFNYKGEDLEREMKEMSVNKDVHQWYRIVYLCESMSGIEIVENPDDSVKTEGTDKRLVRILSKEEAAKIKAEEKVDRSQAHEEVKRVEFEPSYGNRIDDEIIDTNDKNFVKMLNSFNTNKNELDRIRARLLKKIARFFFEQLKRGQLKFVGSILGNNKGAEDGNEEMVKVVDEFVSQSTSNEGSVSGLGSVAKRYYHNTAYQGASGVVKQVKSKTVDKGMVSKYFWYSMAALLLVIGIGLMIGLGSG